MFYMLWSWILLTFYVIVKYAMVSSAYDNTFNYVLWHIVDVVYDTLGPNTDPTGTPNSTSVYPVGVPSSPMVIKCVC